MSEAAHGTPMLLWAGPASAAPEHPNLVIWEGAATRPGMRTMAEVIEAHADAVRNRYLAWTHDFGEVRVFGRPLRERFRFDRDASLWSQSVFVEQSTWRQRSLDPLIKLFALERLVQEEQPRALCFASADSALADALRRLCRDFRIDYSVRALPRQRATASHSLVRALPYFLQGFAALGYFAWSRWPLRGKQPSVRVSQSGRRVLICGPFFNPSGEDAAFGALDSPYWTTLPATLAQEGYSIHWLHYFYVHDRVKDARQARAILQQLNQAGNNGTHACVDSYLTVGALAKIAGRWLKIALESIVVGLMLRRRFVHASWEHCWPLLRADWARTLRGFGSVENLFFAECFDRALQRLPRQDECIYLMENQGWERALCRAWRRRGHGRLAAVAHSTLRYWDLRYHCDARRYETAYRERLPHADVVVVNGLAARREYLATCSQREQVVECEALRYLHLKAGTPRPLESGAGAVLRLLVLGDYTETRTRVMLQLVAQTCANSAGIVVWVKPHPVCPVDPTMYGFDIKVVNRAVAELVPEAHLVLASNTTSAAVDAYVSGGRVLVHDDQSGVNFSPLRGVSGAVFIRNAADLSAAIAAVRADSGTRLVQTRDFFHIDPGLARWRRYFGGTTADRHNEGDEK